MANPDIINQADKALKPVLKALAKFGWIRVVGCCAGHQAEDNLWLEVNALGVSGLGELMHMMKSLDAKLSGTDCRVDCMLDYHATLEGSHVPHGWIPCSIEVSWQGAQEDWRRSQAMVVETFLSAIEESRGRAGGERPSGAINHCPFCSSTFIRLESLDQSAHYKCSDCEMKWTLQDPLV